MKKIIPLILTLVLALSLAACAGENAGDSGGAPKEDAATALQMAMENMNEVTSMSYEMVLEMEMTADGQTVAMDTTATVDYIVEPPSMKLDMSMDMGAGLGSLHTEMYMTQEADRYLLYTGVDMGGGMQWTKQEMTDMAALAQYDAKASFDTYLTGAERFQEKGVSTVSGANAVRYDGVISKDAVNEVMQASGALSQLTSLGISEADAAAMMTGLGEIPISIWVGEENGLPVKYEIDMTAVMRELMDKMMESMGVQGGFSFDQMTTSMTLSNINGVASIVIPEEVLNAA